MIQTDFHVLIPARLASTRLPNKPLALIAGVPMVVRVAQRAQASGALSVTVAADDPSIIQACEQQGVRALLTQPTHPSGSDRLAEASQLLQLPPDAIVVNVQGDEPLIDPALIRAVAHTLHQRPDCVMSTAAHPIHTNEDFASPHVVKVVLDRSSKALYFSRAPIPCWRDAPGTADPDGALLLPASPTALRHVGIYGYRVRFLQRFPALEPAPLETCESLEQLRVLWHGEHIAVHVTPHAPGAGVDTPADLERVRAWFAAALPL
jgi:3-deoxy-manno-octulosonate cytidylyltransferase (CMP-KDO synthetase)